MSGDQRTDEPDPLDDDFVIEDLAGKNDDLESLFTAPGAAKPSAAGPGAPPDEDDVLFSDHTQGLNPSEKFAGKGEFAEAGESQWNGDNLELDRVGVPDDEMREAEQSFTSELGSLLQSEEEFGPDSEKELELVDGGGTGGDDEVNEFEQSSAFVLEDGETQWREGLEEAAASDDSESPQFAEGDGEGVEPALVEDDAPAEPGWEPLPERGVDQLSEVGEVARSEEDGEMVAAAAEPIPDPSELAAMDGHDIYEEQAPAPALVGTRPSARRVMRLLTSIAAALLLLASAAVVVMRPEWFGLAFEPARVQQVHIERPQVQVAVDTPAAPVVAPVANLPEPPPAVDPTPVVTAPVTQPEVPAPTPTPPVVETPVETTPTPVVAAPPSAEGENAWPVQEQRDGKPKGGRDAKGKPLVRLGDDLMLGEEESMRSVHAVDGVLPGSRAFAQLHNGNYFIGSVKLVNADAVTLRLEKGEVTIARSELSRLTELGSSDYEQLQRATSGFIRLTNNNRLVGGILSQIADDHIVLEFRSNRVMLPRSAIDQVVAGQPDAAVRLDVTPKEDDWLKALAERELGTGTGAAAPGAAPNAAPGATPGATPQPSPAPAPQPAPAPAPGRQR